MFRTLDTTSGFLQLELNNENILLTTVAALFGRFLRLPLGISYAPEVLLRTVRQFFSDIDDVGTYVDDLLVHAPTMEH